VDRRLVPGLPTMRPTRTKNREAAARRGQAPALPECKRVERLAPFIVYTAGRSRTAWLASFLTYRKCRCHFETLTTRPSFEHAIELLKPGIGSAETGAAPFWQAFEIVPGLKRVVVKRPADEILKSLEAAIDGRLAIDWFKLKHIVADLCATLDEISAAPGTLTVTFADLAREDTCAAVFEHCLPYSFDRKWWRVTRDKNIQADAAEFLLRHRPALTVPV